MKSKQVKWTIEKIKAGFEKFYAENKRYPTSAEIDAYHALPSSRQIQRRFGGLPAIRTHLKLKGPEDFTKGTYSSDRARTIAKRAHKVENEVYEYLISIFGKPFVHREFFFSDDKRCRTDFYIYYKDGNFLVDVFYPKDKSSFINCLNNKMRVYGNSATFEHPIIFLMMNENIGEETIRKILENKKNKVLKHQRVMTYGQFKEYCKGRVRVA